MPGEQPQQPLGEGQRGGEPGWLEDEDELSGLVLVPGSEPVPAERLLIAEPAGPGGGLGRGLCWSFDVDLDAILAAAVKASPAPDGTGMLPGAAGPAGGLLPDEGGLGLDVVAEYLPGSAALAAWLDQRDPASTSDYDLPAVAAGWRRVAAFAQAREFAAIAQIAVRSAARHEKSGLEEDGRPAAVTPDAAAQVGLALALSPGTAEWWTSQAVTLTWRLPATGAALAAGEIDAYRARLITEATGLLDEDTARAVEDDVLPGAGELTYAQLRSRLRRAVIIADPKGAEDRRKAAERRARVSLYPDDDGTATSPAPASPPRTRQRPWPGSPPWPAPSRPRGPAGVSTCSALISSSASCWAPCPRSPRQQTPASPTHQPTTNRRQTMTSRQTTRPATAALPVPARPGRVLPARDHPRGHPIRASQPPDRAGQDRLAPARPAPGHTVPTRRVPGRLVRTHRVPNRPPRRAVTPCPAAPRPAPARPPAAQPAAAHPVTACPATTAA